MYSSNGVKTFFFIFQDRFHTWVSSFGNKLLHNISFKFTRKFGLCNDFTLIQQTCKKSPKQEFTYDNDKKHYRFTLVTDPCVEHGFGCKCNDKYFNPTDNEEPPTFRLYVHNRLKDKMQVQKIWFIECDNIFCNLA